MNADHICAERMQGKRRDLEELFSERDADDRYAEDCTEQKVCKRHLKTAENELAHAKLCFPERVQRDRAQFEALLSDRNSDN